MAVKNKFVKFGDWDTALRVSNNMSTVVKSSLVETMGKVTVKAERMAVKHISDQDLHWKKLSDSYLKRKKKKGLSEKTLIATSTYFQSITSKVEGFNGYTGVFKQVKNKEGDELANIAMVLEYGSIKRNIPPRRLWSVVFSDTYKWVRNSKIFAFDAINKLKRS